MKERVIKLHVWAFLGAFDTDLNTLVLREGEEILWCLCVSIVDIIFSDVFFFTA